VRHGLDYGDHEIGDTGKDPLCPAKGKRITLNHNNRSMKEPWGVTLPGPDSHPQFSKNQRGSRLKKKKGKLTHEGLEVKEGGSKFYDQCVY